MMSQQNRLLQFSLLGALLLGFIALVYLAAKHFGKQKKRPAIVKRHMKTRPEDALKYWTADRMRDARGVDLPKVEALDQEERRS